MMAKSQKKSCSCDEVDHETNFKGTCFDHTIFRTNILQLWWNLSMKQLLHKKNETRGIIWCYQTSG